MTNLKETEKAVQIQANVYMEVAPKGGFVSSLVRDRNGRWTFWCPKSVIKDNQIAEWFLSKKRDEARNFYENKFFDAQILNINFVIL